MIILNAEEEAMIRAMRQNKITPVMLTESAADRLRMLRLQTLNNERIDDMYLRMKTVEEQTRAVHDASKSIADYFTDIAETGK